MKKLTFLFATLLASMMMSAATYVAKSVSEISATDEIVVAWAVGDSYYAMSNDQGTDKAPAAVEVSVSETKLTTSATNIQWNLSVSDDGYVFYPAGQTETWLYTTATNNGNRVGTNDNKYFSVVSGGDNQADYLQNVATSRYIGVYNKADVRSYTTVNNNIKDQSFAFYVKQSSETPLLEANESSLDFGEVYQGNEVDAKEVAVTLENIAQATASITGEVFSITPTSLTESGKITITANTNVAPQLYTETLTIKADNVEDVTVTITMLIVEKPAMKAFRKAETADLVDGAAILISNTLVPTNILGLYESGNNVKATEATANGDLLEVEGNSTALYTLGYAEQGYTLKDANGKYLYAASTTNNHMKSQENAYYWTIAINAETSEATIQAVENTSRGLMRYNPNNGSPMYACYGSTSNTGSLPVIYVENTEVVKYKVTIAETENGTVAAVADQRAGATVTLDITPAEGYEVDAISVMQGENAVEVSDATFVMPEGDVKVTVTFKEQTKYTITVGAADENGTVAVVGGLTEAAAGTVVLVKIEAKEGYEINVILAGDLTLEAYNGNEDANYQFTMPQGNALISVSFKQIEEAKPLTLAQFLALKPVEEVALVDLTVIYCAKPRTWVVDAEGTAVMIYSQQYENIEAGKVLKGMTATFSDNNGRQVEIIPSNTVEAVDGTPAVPQDFNVALTEADVNKYIRYENVEITKNGNNYYALGVQVYDQFKFGVAEGNYELVGTFFNYNNGTLEIVPTQALVNKTEYNILISAEIENGTVVASADKALAGTEITLTVTPAEGYIISSVMVHGNAIEAVEGVYSFSMPAEDVTVLATFVKEGVVEYDITVADAENGVVTVLGGLVKAEEGTEITLIVIANEGYEVESVVANNTALTANEDGNYQFTMPAENVTIRATFAQIPLEAISLTQFIADQPKEEVLLKDLTVLASDGKNTYVIDEDGVALLIFDKNKTYYAQAVETGKVLKGQKATYTLYNNQVEIIPTNTADIEDGTKANPTIYTEVATADDENKYIAYQSVEIVKDGNNFYAFNKALQMYAAIADFKIQSEGIYNVEGIVVNYKGTQLELILTAVPEKISDIDTALDAVEALDINAPMYNTLGQKVNADYKGIVIQNGKKYILK